MTDQIFNEDALVYASRRFKPESVDLFICDPPFGIGESSFSKHYNRDKDNIIDGYVEAPVDYGSFTYSWMKESYDLLKSNGSMIVIMGHSNLYHVLDAARHLNLFEVNHLIWKYNFGVYTKRKFVTSHYHVLYYSKSKKNRTFNTYSRYGPQEKHNKRSLLYQDLEDVFYIKKENQPGKIKNCNKLPSALIEKLISYCSNAGDTVCDFFMGNFTTAVAAKSMGRNPVGFELNKKAYDEGIKKLSNIVFGSASDSARKFDVVVPRRQGKRMEPMEIESIEEQYASLLSTGMKRKKIVETLSHNFGRGIFSIQNLLKK